MSDTSIISAIAPDSESISVELVDPDSVDRAWPECAEGIGAALVRYLPALLTVDDCRALCKSSRNQLWVVLQGERIVGCAVSELVSFPSGLAVRSFLSSYSAPWAPTLSAAIDAWAASLGVVTVITLGPPRMAWALGTPTDCVTYWRALSGPLAIQDKPALAAQAALH